MKLTYLPDELIGHIVSFLDQPTDFRAFSLVSRDCHRNAKESHPDFPLQLVELDGSYARKSNPLERVTLDYGSSTTRVVWLPGLDAWHRVRFVLRTKLGGGRLFDSFLLFKGTIITYHIHNSIDCDLQGSKIQHPITKRYVVFGGKTHRALIRQGLMPPLDCYVRMYNEFTFRNAPVDHVKSKLPLSNEYETETYIEDEVSLIRAWAVTERSQVEKTVDLMYEIDPQTKSHLWWEAILPQLKLKPVDSRIHLDLHKIDIS